MTCPVVVRCTDVVTSVPPSPSLTPALSPVTAAGHLTANVPYGVPVLSRLLSWLSSLTDPRAHDQDTRVTGLCLINIAFEAGGEGLGHFPSLVTVCQVTNAVRSSGFPIIFTVQ